MKRVSGVSINEGEIAMDTKPEKEEAAPKTTESDEVPKHPDVGRPNYHMAPDRALMLHRLRRARAWIESD